MKGCPGCVGGTEVGTEELGGSLKKDSLEWVALGPSREEGKGICRTRDVFQGHFQI